MLRLWLRNRRSKGARRSPRILHKRAWWPQVDLCYLFNLLTQWEGTSEKPCGEQTLPKCLRVSLQDLFQDLFYQERPGGPHIGEAQKSSPVAQICKERNEQWNRTLVISHVMSHHFRRPLSPLKYSNPYFRLSRPARPWGAVPVCWQEHRGARDLLLLNMQRLQGFPTRPGQKPCRVDPLQRRVPLPLRFLWQGFPGEKRIGSPQQLPSSNQTKGFSSTSRCDFFLPENSEFVLRRTY